ncbi:MAG: EamA family transporter [Candidatus Yanofskybacteria bacterium]|nr:EamA family transporter [Candidatus Yanofskybacteria bacterium]
MFPRIALFLVSFLWGISFVFTKGYLEVLNPITFTAYSFLISGLFFLLIVFYQGKKFSFRLREGILLGVLLFFLEVPQMIGLSLTTAANTAFISVFGILLIPFLERVLYKHKIKLTTFIALITAFSGAYFLTGGIEHFSAGDIWVVIGAIGCLFYMVYSDNFEKEKKSDMAVLCSQQFIIVGAISLFVAIVSRAPLGLQIPDGSWMPFIALTFFFTLIPYLLLQWAERYADEVKITFYNALEPLVGGVAAWTIGAEKATPPMVFGGGLIILALVISEYHRSGSRKN